MTFDRRRFLTHSLAASLASKAAFAQEVGHPTADSSGAPSHATGMSNSELLSYSTVRLAMFSGDKPIGYGTGFFFNLFNINGNSLPVLITNKHVTREATRIEAFLHNALSNGMPDPSPKSKIKISVDSNLFLEHPDHYVDLSCVIMMPELRQSQSRGERPLFFSIDERLIWDDVKKKELTPVEDVLVIGFPGGFFDDVNMSPIFRRGITATPAYQAFDGHSSFLIDAAIWPGSSGSPVLLFNEGSFYDHKNNALTAGNRVALLGVVNATLTQGTSGAIAVQPAPLGPIQTTPGVSVITPIPDNLGVCIIADRILDFEPLLVAAGISPPAGYSMRSTYKP